MPSAIVRLPDLLKKMGDVTFDRVPRKTGDEVEEKLLFLLIYSDLVWHM